MIRTALAFSLAVLLTGLSLAKDPVKSGPQVSEKLAGPFEPLNINGDYAAKKHCLYCENGNNPVAMIFARQPSEALTSLITKLDAACEKNSSKKMGSFVVFCSDDKENLEKSLKDMVEKEKLKKVVLSIDNPAGPKGYKVAEESDITVILYVDRMVKANYTFTKGEMTTKDSDKIIADLGKILE